MNSTRSPILLLHGGWGGAWCWSVIAPLLLAAGHPTLALDLPGGGLNATESHHRRDRRDAALERSALAELSFAQYVAPAERALRSLHERFGPVLVVAHSINGTLLHHLGERSTERILRLVYLAAVGPAPGRTVAMDTAERAWSDSQFASLLVADPRIVGALRIAPRSNDPDYRRAMRSCWFADVAEPRAETAMQMLATDTPASLLGEPATLSAERWGSIPRTWLRTTHDASIPASGQAANVAQLDQAFPSNRFTVESLESGHMPFLSLPDQLAQLLINAATPSAGAP